MLKLKLQYFGHLMRRADSLEKIPQCWERLKVKGEEGDRIKCLDGITDSMDINLSKLWDKVKDREAWVRTGLGTTDWFQIGKGVRQGCILSPCLFNLYAEYIMRNAGLEEAQAGIKIAGRNINNLGYADDTTIMAESKELKAC